MRISIIMPVFSEVENVRLIVSDVKQRLGDNLYEILFIVAPKSIRKSVEMCRNLAENDPVIKFYFQKNNPGMGRAYREGIQYATGDYILFLDSDGQNDLATIDLMLDKIRQENLDLVVASRWIRGGGVDLQDYGLLKYILNRVFNLIFKILYRTNIHDLSFSYKLMRTNLANAIKWEGIGFEFNGENTLKPIKYGYNVAEVPSKTKSRDEGESKYSLRYAWKYVPMALKILFSTKNKYNKL